MLQMIKYSTGECRVIDTARMIASEFLSRTEMDAPLEGYELDCELDDADLAQSYIVVR